VHGLTVLASRTGELMRGWGAAAAAGGRPLTPTAHARNTVRAAAGLLPWLRGRGTELAACGQADIDHWLRTGPSACLARDFLAWATSRGHCQPLTIPPPPRPAGPAISQDQRWALTARLLHDTALDPTDRVTGCLLLPPGPPAPRPPRHTPQPGPPPRGRDVHPARPSRRARPRPARRRRPPADQRRPQPPGSRLPARHHLAVPRAPARPPDH